MKPSAIQIYLVIEWGADHTHQLLASFFSEKDARTFFDRHTKGMSSKQAEYFGIHSTIVALPDKDIDWSKMNGYDQNWPEELLTDLTWAWLYWKHGERNV